MFFITLLRYWTRLKTFAGNAAGVIARAWKTAADFARRVVIYCCLAAVITADWILERIDPENASE